MLFLRQAKGELEMEDDIPYIMVCIYGTERTRLRQFLLSLSVVCLDSRPLLISWGQAVFAYDSSRKKFKEVRFKARQV